MITPFNQIAVTTNRDKVVITGWHDKITLSPKEAMQLANLIQRTVTEVSK